jgi:hypothetical protein
MISSFIDRASLAMRSSDFCKITPGRTVAAQQNEMPPARIAG